MGKKTVRITCAAFVAALVLASCPSAVSRGGSGVVTVNFMPSASRGVLDAPPFPVFSSATVTISGADMSPVSASLVAGTATLEVPAGSNRLVTVDAVPDWSATASKYPLSQVSNIATRYGGSATVNVEAGKTAQANIHFSVTGSNIVLFSASFEAFYLADSFSAVASASNNLAGSLPIDSDFELDQYGRLYVSALFGIVRIDGYTGTELIGTSIVEEPAYPILRFALDKANNRLYSAGVYESGQMGFYDPISLEYYNFNAPEMFNWSPYNPSTNLFPRIAVDDSGGVYMLAYDDDEGINYVAKIAVGAPYYTGIEYVADISIQATISYADAGLNDGYGTPLLVEDMTVVGDKLYILAGDVDDDYYSRSHGKIVALRTSDLRGVQSAGWSESDMPTDPTTQFYGPARFVGVAPGKLYVADDGYAGPSDRDRVVEVSLEPLSISGVSSVPFGITFFRKAPDA